MRIFRWLQGERAGAFTAAEYADPERLIFEADETTALLPLAMVNVARMADERRALTTTRGPGQ